MKDVGKQFLQATSYPYVSESDQNQEVPCPDLETPLPAGHKIIDLPAPEQTEVKDVTVSNAINRRRSKRNFDDKPVSLMDLSYLLWSTNGVKEKLEIASLRTVPSAGARHPFDTWLAVHNVDGLEPGLYRYLAFSHQLALIKPDKDITEHIVEGSMRQKWIRTAAVTFIWVAVPYRCAWRYSERAWRYIFLDAGHVCQNLYLASEEIGWGCCAVAAYDDAFMNKMLGLDGEEQFVIYMAPAGQLKGRK
ncbi:MAG: SagB/ThcOx family dehydrogenase [Firmicutes bacterium]|nr:SagB/ThcOx family dehydrogenase [Bacillota bacterium]